MFGLSTGTTVKMDRVSHILYFSASVTPFLLATHIASNAHLDTKKDTSTLPSRLKPLLSTVRRQTRGE